MKRTKVSSPEIWKYFVILPSKQKFTLRADTEITTKEKETTSLMDTPDITFVIRRNNIPSIANV